MTDPSLAGAFLEINLDALKSNYRRLLEELDGVPCGAAVKADAYGLGVEPAVRALWDAGTREFFTASIEEGISVRKTLPEAAVHILNGVFEGAEHAFLEHRLVPVLNSLSAVEVWRAFCSVQGHPLPCDLHLDTGMCRLGLDKRETARLLADMSLIDGLDIQLVMSHLASADDASSPQSDQQLALFKDLRRQVTAGQASFANSSGIFLSPEYHFDLGRPGVALYGVNPTPHTANPMTQVVGLKARILQVRDVDRPETVGYGAAHAVDGPARIATLPVGYADGYLRSLSGRTTAWVGEHEVSVVGRVSMDLITIDVTNVPEPLSRSGSLVDLIGPRHDVDAAAHDAGTIGYEILTSLGRRYHRTYIQAGDGAAA